MSKFYFSYQGNKRKEFDKIISMCNFENIETIIECFGGSLAFSFELWKTSSKKFNYIITDKDKELTYFCNNFHKNKSEILDKIMKIIEPINNKEEYGIMIKKYKSLKITDEEWMPYFYIWRTFFNIRSGLYPTTRNKPTYKKVKEKSNDYDHFFRENEYLNLDAFELLEKYKDDTTVLFYLDPPYVNANVDEYFEKTIDWKRLYDTFKVAKCKIVLHVNFNFWMDTCFTPIAKNKITYPYTYQNHATKKKNLAQNYHTIYTNF